MAISGEQFEKECRVKHYQDVAGQAQVDRRSSDRRDQARTFEGYSIDVDTVARMAQALELYRESHDAECTCTPCMDWGRMARMARLVK